MFLTLLGEYAADLPLSEYLDSMKVNFNKNEKFQKLNSIDYNKAVAISNLEDLGGSKKSIFSFKKIII
ncbi:hypothetical protein U2P60_10245 [Brucella sp. H1_1004]|uniref:hypothetical protein n=1 Tax=Brucella sp. H1_1004 TaxID=3110109 RepID=UPI0039B5CF87